jgi:hypothetical protein
MKPRLIKTVSMGVEAAISLMHPIHTELSGLQLEPLHYCDLDVFIKSKSTAI